MCPVRLSIQVGGGPSLLSMYVSTKQGPRKVYWIKFWSHLWNTLFYKELVEVKEKEKWETQGEEHLIFSIAPPFCPVLEAATMIYYVHSW